MTPANRQKVGRLKRTLLQALVIWILSNVPLACVALWQWWSDADALGLGFFGYLAKNLQTGEAFLYVSAFVAPFFWTVVTYNDESRRIPMLILPLILAALSLGGSAFLFAAYRAAPDGKISQIPYIGGVLYLIGLGIWIKSLYDDHVLPQLKDPTAAGRARVRDIVDSL